MAAGHSLQPVDRVVVAVRGTRYSLWTGWLWQLLGWLPYLGGLEVVGAVGAAVVGRYHTHTALGELAGTARTHLFRGSWSVPHTHLFRVNGGWYRTHTALGELASTTHTHRSRGAGQYRTHTSLGGAGRYRTHTSLGGVGRYHTHTSLGSTEARPGEARSIDNRLDVVFCRARRVSDSTAYTGGGGGRAHRVSDSTAYTGRGGGQSPTLPVTLLQHSPLHSQHIPHYTISNSHPPGPAAHP